MSTLYPHVHHHKKYPSTFLINVEWRLYFVLGADDKAYELLSQFVKDSFGLELRREYYDAMGILPLRYDQSDDAAGVKISRQFAEFSFNSNGYTSFVDSAKDILYSFIKMIYESGGSLNHAMCNKKNLVSMKRSEVSDEYEILSFVLSDHLLNEPHKLLRGVDFTQNMTPSTRFYTAMQDDLIIQVLYGAYINKDVSDSNADDVYEYGVMVESQCDCTHQMADLADAHSTIERINDIMYDFMHWAFTPGIIQIMEIDMSNDQEGKIIES